MSGADPKTVAVGLGSRKAETVGDDRPSDTSILPPLSPVGRLRLATEALSTYVEVRWRLWKSDLSATLCVLRSHADRPWKESDLESHWQGVRLAKATTRTLSVLPTDSRCLMQSLVLIGLLSRRSIGSVLIVAVNSRPDFEAHAWVEHNGRPLLPAGEYGRLVEL